ncbi:NAD(P)-binding protein [Xylariaceae sp. FL0804]|nr:NAD(P)-binding protein [Xylariaceae sp. FL0804]
MSLAGRLAIIAGGLGGLGSATGKILRSQGARLALLYAPSEAGRAQELLRTGYGATDADADADAASAAEKDGGIRTYECDITSPASVQSAFGSVAADMGASAGSPPAFPGILVNAAGYVSLSDLAETPPEETAKHLAINVLGPMLCSQAFARMYFRAAEEMTNNKGMGMSMGNDKPPSPPPGRIVSVSSQAAHVALWRHGAYCASKAALLGLTRSMASEWGPRGITANTVSPTVAWTELGRKAWGERAVSEAFLRQVPAGRFVMPDEVAGAVAFLCQDGNGMINGADLRIDGGFTIR